MGTTWTKETSPSGDHPFLLVGPLVLFLVVFLAYPTAYAVKLALTNRLDGAFPSIVNFRVLWDDPLFWRALTGNITLPLASVTLELLVGMGLALLLSARFPGRRGLRAVVILPFALPEIVLLTIMRYVFAPRGYANAALMAVGLGPFEWTLPGSPLTFLTVVAVDAWHVTPVVFLMLLAGLTSIPDEVDQAAQLDGAGSLRRFLFITLPLLWPTILAALVLRGVDALRVFATPLVLTGVEGFPVLSSYAYHQWSDYGDDGAAAAAATLLALLSVVMTAPLLRHRAGKRG